MRRHCRQVSCNGITYFVTPLPVSGWRIQVADGCSHPQHGQLIPGSGCATLADVESKIRRHANVPAPGPYRMILLAFPPQQEVSG